MAYPAMVFSLESVAEEEEDAGAVAAVIGNWR